MAAVRWSDIGNWNFFCCCCPSLFFCWLILMPVEISLKISTAKQGTVLLKGHTEGIFLVWFDQGLTRARTRRPWMQILIPSRWGVSAFGCFCYGCLMTWVFQHSSQCKATITSCVSIFVVWWVTLVLKTRSFCLPFMKLTTSFPVSQWSDFFLMAFVTENI